MSRRKSSTSSEYPPSETGRVVLCGSMSSLHDMDRITDQLTTHGVETLRPAVDDAFEPWLSESDVHKIKRDASAQHMQWIKEASTRAILVVNVDKDGRSDYIGPNSFAEIAVAFSEGREIYLFHGIPQIYEDELKAWGVRCLNGDLTNLIETYSKHHKDKKVRRDARQWGTMLLADI